MRSRLTIFTILLLLSTTVGAQEYYYNLKFQLSPKNFADTIPIEVENGRIYLPVTIDGETHRFLLDTGASMGAVYAGSPTASDGSLHSKASQGPSVPVGTITSHDATGQTRSTEVVRLPDLHIGRLTVSGYHASLLPPPPTFNPSPKPAGIIGFDIFNKGLLGKIDTRSQQLILTDRKNHFRREQGYETRYVLQRHVPYAILYPFGWFEERVRFDTGDRSLYTMSRRSFDAAFSDFPADVERQVEGRAHGRQRISHFGAESTDEVVALCLRSLRWGDLAFRNVHTLTAQGPSAVGSAILDYGTVIINPCRRRLVFQPYAGGSPCLVDNRLPDIYYIPDSHGLPAVSLVWEDSEPYRQGFRQGDVITAVNGTPVKSVADFIGYPFVANQTYTITVRDKHGSIRQLKLTK